MCIAGGYCGGGMQGRGCAWHGVVHGRGHEWWVACMAEETATAADGPHPTGMHSCSINKLTQNRQAKCPSPFPY